MSLIKHVSVRGLWGYRDFNLPFDKHINFLVGPNGSGKTALINLVAGALTGDEVLLKREPFTSVEVTLTDRSSDIRKVSVAKEVDSLAGECLNFAINDEPVKSSLRTMSRSVFRRVGEDHGLRDRLTNGIPLTWLRIDRRTQSSSPRFSDGASTPIDQRIEELSERLTRYFSELQSEVDKETQNFIRYVFSNLLPYEESVASKGNKTISFSLSEAALRQIFENFQITDNHSQRRLDNYFRRLKTVTGKVKANPKDWLQHVDFPDVMVLFWANNVGNVVQKWEEVSERKKEIFSQRELFLRLLQKLMAQKPLSISSRNELEIHTREPVNRLRLSDLSSGEKQIIIMLGEALLHRQQEHIYIADEPELSLHITWQESLVDVLSELNPNVQIIFATHSPDIVGNRIKNAFDVSLVGHVNPR